jgi:hypothetical protein
MPNQKLGSAIRAAYKAQSKSNAVQTGATTGAAGTTSAVSKPASPLSLATEYGGITSSTSNQTITFQAPLDGIPRALATHGVLPYCSTTLIRYKGCAKSVVLNALNFFGIGVSMNTNTPSNSVTATATGTSQGSSQAVTATSTGTDHPSFAGASVKVSLWRPLADLPSITAVSGAAQQSAAFNTLTNLLSLNNRYKDWAKCVTSQFMTATIAQRPQVFQQYYAQIKQVLEGMDVDCSPVATQAKGNPNPADASDQKVTAAFLDYVAKSELTQASFDEAVVSAESGKDNALVSFEYDIATPANQPTNSTYKLVGTKSWPEPSPGKEAAGATAPWTATINVGASLYNSEPPSSVPNASILRDIQAGIEVDRIIASSKWPGILGKLGDSTASLTYYYQDLTSPSIIKVTPGTPLTGITLAGLSLSATTIFTKKGPINVGQFKYGFGTGKNVKFPLAVTYTNRTELITHSAWTAQFGVSYDFTSLLPSGSQ